MNLTFYHTAGCHLCEDMAHALTPLTLEFGFNVTFVDIETDPDLEETYGARIPVLVCEGSEICHYRLDEAALRRYVEVRKVNGSTR